MGTFDASVTIRLRSLVWFGAGVAATLITVALFVGVRATAAPGANEATFVPITPCRLVDTRPGLAVNVGPRNTPIGPGETHEQQVTGSNGNCSIPASATGISINATAVNPTAASFMTIFPFDASLPAVSNLNYTPGAPPTPNKVDVKLSTDGKLGFYNLAGTVHLIADVGGYYTNAGIQNLQDQINKKHVWSAKATAAGDKVGKGNFTISKFNTGPGHYGVNFDVSSADYADSAWFTTVATPICAGYTATVSHGGGSSTGSGRLNDVTPNVTIYDKNGDRADCGFSMLMSFEDPNPRIIIPF